MVDPARYDLVFYRGVTFDLFLSWKDETGVIYDLSAFTAKMQIRTSPEAPTTIVDMTTENNEIILDSIAPNIVLHLSSTITTTFPVICGAYDLKLIDTNGVVILLLKGKAEIKATVTR